MRKLRRNVSDPASRQFWDNVAASAQSLEGQPSWVAAGVHLHPSSEDEPSMPEIKQCRHVRTGLLVASTTLKHESIGGRALLGGEPIEFSTTMELCGVCSGVLLATLHHLEAGPESAQDAFGQVVEAVRDMNAVFPKRDRS